MREIKVFYLRHVLSAGENLNACVMLVYKLLKLKRRERQFENLRLLFLARYSESFVSVLRLSVAEPAVL